MLSLPDSLLGRLGWFKFGCTWSIHPWAHLQTHHWYYRLPHLISCRKMRCTIHPVQMSIKQLSRLLREAITWTITQHIYDTINDTKTGHTWIANHVCSIRIIMQLKNVHDHINVFSYYFRLHLANMQHWATQLILQQLSPRLHRSSLLGVCNRFPTHYFMQMRILWDTS